KELVSLETRPEVFTYTVSQVIPGGAVNVVFSDTLEDVLEVVGMPTLNVPGAEVKVDGQVVTATIADATSLATQTVTLTINAKLRDGVTDAQLIEAYGNDEQVPNKATVTIDGTPNVTNEVLVTPPPVGSVIVKYITEDGTILEDWSDVQSDVPAVTDYTTEQKTFEGYEFVKMDDTSAEANGKTIAPGTLEVIYVYKPVVEPVGSVIVKYITEDGTILEDWSDVQRDVPAGTDYTTTQKEFDGYEFVKMDDASAEANGKTIAPGTLEVIYVYKPINEEPYEPDNPNRNYTTNKFDLTFTKTLDDKIVTEAGKFNFVLVGISENAKGMEFKAANDANGQVSFKDIEIKQPGDYLFSVSEVIPSDTKGIIYDQTVYTLHVHIYRKGTETLAEWWITKADSAVELEAADYVFKNETEPEVPEEPTEPEKPTPDTPTTPTPSTPTPTTPTPTTPTTTTTPAPTTPTQTTTTTGATTVARTATAKTGDATNLALMGGMAVAGLLVLVAARKVREN
ncbi:MAG: MucBP domain-containing protein, partial [Atopobiaceae bacterium]|nr:MucBP domain-containing protein [Atopobiaceae bacterium]